MARSDVTARKPSGQKKVRGRMSSYHHGALREALLKAAEAVLLEHGVEGFTLRECARRAQVSHGAPAHHFGDVRGLLSEFTAVSFEQLDALMSAYRARSSPTPTRSSPPPVWPTSISLANRARFQLMFRSDRLDSGNARLEAAATRTYRQLVDTVAAVLPPQARTREPTERIALAWSIAHGISTLMLDNRLFAHPAGGAPGGMRSCGPADACAAVVRRCRQMAVAIWLVPGHAGGGTTKFPIMPAQARHPADSGQR